MVAVAPLVVHPCARIAYVLTLGFVRAAHSLKIPYAVPEFGGAVFAEVVHKPPPRYSGAETVDNYLPPVAVNGVKMSVKSCCKIHVR